MNISDYLRTALLNHALGVVAFTKPTTVWAALYTSAPTSAGGGIEIVASDYVRVTTTWNLGALGSTTNSADIRFPVTGVTLNSWGTATSLGLFDTPTGGNLLFFGALSAPVVVNLGTDFKVAAASLTITMS